MLSRPRLPLAVLALSGALLAVPGAALAAPASFTPLGGLIPGYALSVASALSPDGGTVVGTSESPLGPLAFVWKEGRGMFDIGSGALGASGVSDGGGAVVGALRGSLGIGSAYRWGSDNTATFLGGGAEALAISADGSATAGSLPFTANGFTGTDAALWTDAGFSRFHVSAQVSGYGPADLDSRARAVSADGAFLAGDSSFRNLVISLPPRPGQPPQPPKLVPIPARAYRWDVATGARVQIPDLPGGVGLNRGEDAQAYAISADGGVVVGRSRSNRGLEAFRWTPAGGTVPLGDLPGFGFGSIARAVTPDGSVVAGMGIQNGENHAWLWDAASGMRDLNDLLRAAGLEGELAGWTLYDATGVTKLPDGTLVVVGNGTDPFGRTQAFRATLPPTAMP